MLPSDMGPPNIFEASGIYNLKFGAFPSNPMVSLSYDLNTPLPRHLCPVLARAFVTNCAVKELGLTPMTGRWQR